MTATLDHTPDDSVSGAASPDSRLIAGRFRLLEPLGRGGMGRVFRARDELLGRMVAVKLIYDDAIVDSDLRHACALEARAAARLNHPGIVRILDSGFDDGHLYVVMSLAEGRTLSEIIRSEGPLPTVRALAIAAQVADALATAHAEGIIHCDVKPGNLIVREDGTVQLVDFGIAKIAASTTSLDGSTLQGSAEYVSPEQVEGAALDGRTDLYALGVVLYESLSGQTPFGGGTIASVLARRLVSAPPSIREARPDVPPAVEQIVTRMLARDPAERFQSAADLRDALQAARAAAVAATLPPPPVSRLTATMPFPRARTASPGVAARQDRFRWQDLGPQTGGASSAALRSAILQAKQAAGRLGLSVTDWLRQVWSGLAWRSEVGARTSHRPPPLVTGFAIAIVVGLLIGTAAARCSVAGATEATAGPAPMAPAAALAEPQPTVPPPPTPAPTMPPPTPTFVVAQPAPTQPPPATALPTATPPPPPPTVPAEAPAPAPVNGPPSEPPPDPPGQQPAQAPDHPPEGPPTHLLITAPVPPERPEPPRKPEQARPAGKPEHGEQDAKRPEDKQPDDKKRDDQEPEDKKADDKRPDDKKPERGEREVRKPEGKKPEGVKPGRGAKDARKKR